MKALITANHATHQRTHAAWIKAGLERHGIACDMAAYDEWRACDLAVIWGWRQHHVIASARAAGVPVLVMERGYLGDRFQWTSIGFNGLNGRATFPRSDDSGARFAKYFTLGIDRGHADYILLAGQVAGDQSIDGVDIDRWYAETVKGLSWASMPVAFRPHPIHRERYGPQMVPGAEVLGGTLKEALHGAAWVVTYNSNMGVDAAIAGVPVVACDQGSMAWPVAGHAADDLPEPLDDREPWAADLAWAQWLPHEIETGAAWDALKPVMDQL